jgi:hypothetical protein
MLNMISLNPQFSSLPADIASPGSLLESKDKQYEYKFPLFMATARLEKHLCHYPSGILVNEDRGRHRCLFRNYDSFSFIKAAVRLFEAVLSLSNLTDTKKS